MSSRRVPERPWPGPTSDYAPGVPSPNWETPSEPALYLQQVQLGHEAPWQVEEAVASVGEGHRHGRPTAPGTHQAFAAPHHLPTQIPRPPTPADPDQNGRPRASKQDKVDRSRLFPLPLPQRRLLPHASRGRSKQAFPGSPGLSAAPLGGGTSLTESSLAGNNGRFFSQSRHALTHPSFLLDKQ